MPATGTSGWEDLESSWRSETPGGHVPHALHASALARRRHALRSAALDHGLLLAGVVMFVILVRYGTQFERFLWGLGMPAFAACAVVEWVRLRRRQWQAAAEGTTVYLTQTLECLHRRLRLVARTWQLYGAMILLDVAVWAWRYLDDPASILALREIAALTLFGLSMFSAALAAWSWAYVWRGRAERSALELLRADFDPLP